MKFEIKHKYSGKILFSVETKSLKLAVELAISKKTDLSSANLNSADLSSANLRFANLRSADLSSANLNSADLSSANLNSADLSSANLRFANLSFANLRFANLNSADLRFANLNSAKLSYAKGINKYRTTPLCILQDQIGKIRAYKLVNAISEGPFNGGIKYEIGKTISVKKADVNENLQCSYGISLATLDWCMANWQTGYRILVCEFTHKDLACIPIATDGKFRVTKCTPIRPVNLEKIGLKTK